MTRSKQSKGAQISLSNTQPSSELETSQGYTEPFEKREKKSEKENERETQRGEGRRRKKRKWKGKEKKT